MLEIDKKMQGESIREYVIRIMKMNVINLNLKPGECVSEIGISKELGLSRTPVREAFIKLSQEELLDIIPQKGTYVSLIDLDIVEEAKFLRKALEKAIIETSLGYITDKHIEELEENIHLQEFYVNNKNYMKLLDLDNQFHRLIFSACKKDRIYSFMESINIHLTRVRVLRLVAIIDIDLMLTQHKDILNAIKERDPQKIEKVMDIHTSGNVLEPETMCSLYPSYFKPR